MLGVDQQQSVRKSHCYLWYFHAFHATYFLRCCARFLKIAQTLQYNILIIQLIRMVLENLIELTNSPNVGEAPHAISVSSADITTDVLEHPILVICQPV